MRDFKDQRGKVGYIILWLLGAPVAFFSSSFFCAVALNRTLTR